MKKQPLQKDPVRGGCMQCPGNHDLLEMDTVLYNGFGGYRVEKDGKLFYEGDPAWDADWEKYMTLQQLEKEAQKEPKADWRVILNLPLRSGEWQRHGENEWVLINSGIGFA